MPLEQLTLPALHSFLLFGLGMVVAEDVKHTVDDEQGELVVDGAGVLVGVSRRDRRTHHDVAEQQRHVIDGRAHRGLGVERERQHVGRRRVAHVHVVQVGDGSQPAVG